MSNDEAMPTPANSTDTTSIMTNSSQDKCERAEADKPKSLIDLPAELKKIIVDKVLELDWAWCLGLHSRSLKDTDYRSILSQIPLMQPLCKGMGMEYFAQEYLYNHCETRICTDSAGLLELPPAHVLAFVRWVTFYGVPLKEEWSNLVKLAVSEDDSSRFPNLKWLTIRFSVVGEEHNISADHIREMMDELKERPLKFKTDMLTIRFESKHSRGYPRGERMDRLAVPSRYRRLAEQLFKSISIVTNKEVVRDPEKAGRMRFSPGADSITAQVVFQTV